MASTDAADDPCIEVVKRQKLDPNADVLFDHQRRMIREEIDYFFAKAADSFEMAGKEAVLYISLLNSVFQNGINELLDLNWVLHPTPKATKEKFVLRFVYFLKNLCTKPPYNKSWKEETTDIQDYLEEHFCRRMVDYMRTIGSVKAFFKDEERKRMRTELLKFSHIMDELDQAHPYRALLQLLSDGEEAEVNTTCPKCFSEKVLDSDNKGPMCAKCRRIFCGSCWESDAKLCSECSGSSIILVNIDSN